MSCCENKAVTLPLWDPNISDACVVDFSKKLMGLASELSCGRCVLCREGTLQVYEIFKEISLGSGRREDYELSLELLSLIEEHAECDTSREASRQVLSLLKSEVEEWERHIKRNKCSQLVCKSSFTLYVDPEVCDGCHLCVNSCLSKAILGEKGLIHVIDTEVCSKSLSCLKVCPKGAIKKAGAVRPKLPLEPIPVGSFETSGGEEENDASGMRRRRRR